MDPQKIGYCSKHHLPKIKRPRVFISYSNNNKSQVALLRNLKKAGYLDFVDYSIKKPYQARWYESAKYRIRESDCVLLALNESVLGEGMLTEINIAEFFNKPILVVRNNQNLQIPRILWNYRVKLVPFDCRSIQREFDRAHRKHYRYY